VPGYAIAAMEIKANDLLQQLALFQVPVESWGGGHERFNRLRNQAACWLGKGTIKDTRSDAVKEEELRAMAEVEAEVARDFPIFTDPQRLMECQKQVGSWGDCYA
jgi:hypothetical protein